MGELNADITLICPALPVNGRTVVHGHLFVNGQLVNKSGMQHPPITPMKDANLIRLMEQQAQGKTGLVDLTCVHQGEQAIRKQLNKLQQQGIRYAVVDAMSMNDLLPIASAVSELTLVTGGSGLGAALASTNTGKLLSPPQPEGATPPAQNRRTVILSGSCSVMTNKQVAQYQKLALIFSCMLRRCFMSEQALRTELVEWARSMFYRGYRSGGAGNISAKLDDGTIIITPTNSSFGDLQADRLSKLDIEGNWLSGDKPTKEVAMHPILLSNHGPVVGGKTLRQAFFNAEELEDTARLYLTLLPYGFTTLNKGQVQELETRYPKN